MNHRPPPNLIELFSKEALALLTATGPGLIEMIGLDVIRGVVLDVLTGRNIRASTETLTRRRIGMLNLAMAHLFMQGSAQYDDFVDNLPSVAAGILKDASSKSEQWLGSWLLGLTGKGIQNILRDDHSQLPIYREIYVETCQNILEESRHHYGDLHGTMHLSTGLKVEVNWLWFLYLLNTIGSQTLTIRGSEKSIYGKFFEKLVLGTLLSLLGFQHVATGDLEQTERVFWLASAGERSRESDATLLYEPGRGIRIDIGFIGRGNTEISLDKVSRYQREIEMGSRHWYMGTLIIVDRIGPRSRIRSMAADIGGTIVQMSGGYWPKRVATVLHEWLGYEHELLKLEEPEEIEDYLAAELAKVPLMDFIAAGDKEN